MRWFPSYYDSTLKISSIGSAFEQIRQSIMPITVLAIYQGSMLMRFVRSAVLEELNYDYVRTAYSKGLSEIGVVVNHIVRNALIPVVTLIALDIPAIFTGALITEQVFRVPGIGSLLVESIYRSDTPVVMAITFIYAILIIICLHFTMRKPKIATCVRIFLSFQRRKFLKIKTRRKCYIT